MNARNGFSNPIREAIKEGYHVFGPKALVSCLLSIGSGFRGVLALNDDINDVAQGVPMDCERTAREVKQHLANPNVYYRLSVDRGLGGWGSFGAGFGAMKSHVNDYLGRDGDMDYCITASTKAGRISMGKICESGHFEMLSLISGRRSQGTRNLVKAWNSTSIRVLRNTQEANGHNRQGPRRPRSIDPADYGNFGARWEWEDATGVEVCARFPGTVRNELTRDVFSDYSSATSIFSSSTPALQTA
jgi:hypothetical protein